MSTAKKVWDSFLSALKSAVRIQHQEQPILPLLSVSYRNALMVNLHSLIAQAQWAVLQHQSAVYQDSLSQIESLLKQYFLATDTQTQSVLSAVQGLMKVDLMMTMPDLEEGFSLPESTNSVSSKSD